MSGAAGSAARRSASPSRWRWWRCCAPQTFPTSPGPRRIPRGSSWRRDGRSHRQGRYPRTAPRCPRPGYADSGWHSVTRMPATVLQALQQDGTYPDLYVGTKLRDDVPADLYEQDWWYRTTFTAPPGHATYLLDFPGINYRAEIWLNGHRIADSTRIVGMHTRIRSTPRGGSITGPPTPWRSRSHRSDRCRTSTGSSSPTAGTTGSTGDTWAIGRRQGR